MTVSQADFSGRTAVVTGAAVGIGAAVSVYLAARGATVVLGDIDGDGVRAVASSINAKGGRAHARVGSSAEPDTAADLVACALRETGQLDIAVAMAGDRLDLHLGDDPVDIQRALDTHVLGTMWLVRSALGPMQERGYGRIVAATSGIGAFGLAGFSVHAACTAAVAGIVRSVALELTEGDVRINALAPVAATPGSAPLFAAHLSLDASIYDTASAAAATALLCHEDCRLNGDVLSAAAGRVARIFSSTVPGWCEPAGDHHALAARLGRIVSTEHPIHPRSALDEFLLTQV